MIDREKNSPNMDEETGENEEYFSEIRQRAAENKDKDVTDETLPNVGGTPKDDEYFSELGRERRPRYPDDQTMDSDLLGDEDNEDEL